jgi:hypothetical protein
LFADESNICSNDFIAIAPSKRRVAWYTIVCVAALIVGRNLYQLASLGHERRTYPMPGRLVDVVCTHGVGYNALESALELLVTI